MAEGGDIAGQIAVELILRTEKFKAQLDDAFKKGAAMWAKAFPQGGGPGVPGPLGTAADVAAADKAVQATKKQEAAVKNLTSALKAKKQAALEAWRASVPPPKVEMLGSTAVGKMGQIQYAHTAAEVMTTAPVEMGAPKVQAIKGPGLTPAQVAAWSKGQATKAPYTGLIPPVITQQAVKQQQTTLASMLNNLMTKTLTGPQAALAKFMGGLAALRVAIGLVSYAVRMVIYPLQKVFALVMGAAEQARNLYGATLQSGGLPMGFAAHRRMLGDVFGVSERDVFQFRQQIRVLGDDLRYSSQVIADTGPTLAGMAWEWKVLGWDMKALKAQVAYDLQPLIHVVFNTIHAGLTNLIWAAKLFSKTAEFTVGKWFLKLIGQGMPEIPAPVASARRYETSTFERQGLVLGGGMGANYGAQTANNTRRTAEILAVVAQNTAMLRTGHQYMKPTGANNP